MFRTAFILTLTLALTACATPSVDQDADNFDNTEFVRDLNLCRGGNILASSATTIGKTAVGSMAGAGIMFLHGAAAAGSAEAIVAGAAIGALVGLGVGAKDAIKDHKQEIRTCLLKKGYKIVGDGAINMAEAVDPVGD